MHKSRYIIAAVRLKPHKHRIYLLQCDSNRNKLNICVQRNLHRKYFAKYLNTIGVLQ